MLCYCPQGYDGGTSTRLHGEATAGMVHCTDVQHSTGEPEVAQSDFEFVRECGYVLIRR